VSEGFVKNVRVVVACQGGRSVVLEGRDYVMVVLTLADDREEAFALPVDLARALSKQLADWADTPRPFSN
jgi:hypothetical protein